MAASSCEEEGHGGCGGGVIGPRQSFLEKRWLLLYTSLSLKVSLVLIERVVFRYPSTSQTVMVATTAVSRITEMKAQPMHAP